MMHMAAALSLERGCKNPCRLIWPGVIFALCSCVCMWFHAASLEADEPGKWTIMIYMVGDNDLEEVVVPDIEDELAYSNGDINILVLADRHPGWDDSRGDWTGTLLFRPTEGMTAEPGNAIEDWGEANMGDGQTLEAFITWSKTHYPAQRYALILWDHGWAWRPYQSLWDETDDDTLDPHELLSVLESTGPFDIVGFDGCEMQSVEVGAQLRSHAEYVVGSQDDMAWTGFEYENVLPDLQAEPDMNAEALALLIAQSERDYTSSVVALNEEWDALIDAVDDWAAALLENLPDYKTHYDLAWQNTLGMADPLNKDLGDAAKEIESTVADADIQAKSQAVITAVNKVVLYEWHTAGWGYPGNATGLTIFWPKLPRDLDEPSSPQDDFEYYRQELTFAASTAWDEFIDAYANFGLEAPENEPPNQPAPTSPPDGQTETALTVRLQTASFSDPDDGDTHGKTRWQIGKDANFSAMVFDRTTSSHLTSLPIPEMLLDANKTYYWRVNFHDLHDDASEWSEVSSFSTVSVPPDDADLNGIPDNQEVDAALDLNGDGVPDVSQDDMMCVNTAVGGGQIGIAYGTDVSSIRAIASVDPSDIAAVDDRPDELPLGLVCFKLDVDNAGDTATVTVYLSEEADSDAKWYKYDFIDGWQDDAGRAVFSESGKAVTLTLEDGGDGDVDGVENGIIVDPSGIGTASFQASEAFSRGRDGGEGDGCFISSLSQ